MKTFTRCAELLLAGVLAVPFALGVGLLFLVFATALGALIRQVIGG